MSVFTLRTLIALAIASCVNSRSLNPRQASGTQTDSNFDELEELKQQIRSRVASKNIYNLFQFNMTLEAKRNLLRFYREKLREMNELDEMDDQEPIHTRQFYSYPVQKGDYPSQYKFNINIPQPEDHRKETKVQSANLQLYRRIIKNINLSDTSTRNIGLNTVLLIYQLLPHGMRRLVKSKVISLANSGWISIDIKEIVQTWIDEPGMNHGLEIECTNMNITEIFSPMNSSSVYSHHSATLDIYTYEKSITTRRKQRDLSQEEICEPGRCCRKAVNITYADVNMHIDGIHAPGEHFTAYTCSGRCPRNFKLHNTWSNFKNTLRINGNKHLRNRCAPTAYEKTFRHFHFDSSDALTFTEYDDIIVKECGCV